MNLALVKKLKKDMTPSELRASYMANSEMFLFCSPGKKLYIELRGELAQIPNMKRGRMTLRSGVSIINKGARAKIGAMDKMFNELNIYGEGVRFDQSSFPLVCIVETAMNKRKFDAIGCAETILDWFEPKEKQVGKNKRGWGVGVYEDDTNVIAIPLKSEQTGSNLSFTRITLCPLSDVKEHLMNLLAGAMI